MKSLIAGAVVVVLVIVFALPLGLVILISASTSSAAATSCGAPAGQIDLAKVTDAITVPGITTEQLVNAAHIMNAASTLALTTHAQQLGVMTALGESSLENKDNGDNAINPDGSIADSVGLFQQQSSWGSHADRMDPEKSATLFFQRLVGVVGWELMTPTAAAHAVQVNLDANHYTPFWDTAVSITDALAHSASSAGGNACVVGQAAYPLDQPFYMSDNFGPRTSPTEGASSWHPADDLVGGCGAPIYAVLPGTVTASDRLTLSIQSVDGYTISYLHSHLADRSVNIGDQVTTGQQISKVGDEAPATGCHLDIRINVTGNTNPQVAALQTFPEAPNYVDPEKFMALFGIELCPAAWCTRNY